MPLGRRASLARTEKPQHSYSGRSVLLPLTCHQHRSSRKRRREEETYDEQLFARTVSVSNPSTQPRVHPALILLLPEMRALPLQTDRTGVRSRPLNPRLFPGQITAMEHKNLKNAVRGVPDGQEQVAKAADASKWCRPSPRLGLARCLGISL